MMIALVLVLSSVVESARARGSHRLPLGLKFEQSVDTNVRAPVLTLADHHPSKAVWRL